MTDKEKKLLLADLAARTAFGVMVEQSLYPHVEKEQWLKSVQKNDAVQLYWYKYINEFVPIHCVKPYLRPMSSMTDKEKEECCSIFNGSMYQFEVNEYGDVESTKETVERERIYYDCELMAEWMNWLNEHHFDFRGLIEKGLAIEAPKDMYK